MGRKRKDLDRVKDMAEAKRADEQLKEVVSYLQTAIEYKRIMKEILKKYKQLGRLGGSICLDKLTEKERVILAPLDYSLYTAQRCKIPVQKFVDHFCTGRFEGIDFTEILRVYNKGVLVSNKDLKNQETFNQEKFFLEIYEASTMEEVRQWIYDTYNQKTQGYALFVRQYKEDQIGLKENIKHIDKAILYLKEKSEAFLPLVMLASHITKNPHYFDFDTIAFKLLLYFFCFKEQINFPATTEEKNEILYKEGLLRDELSTSTICYGVQGYTKTKDLPWEQFWAIGEPLQLMLYNLKNITKFTTTSQKVYVVENPTVFKIMLENFKDKKCTLVCTRGQLNTADLMLLDGLVASGATLYYNGDFDPEGLQIAQKIKWRYKEQAVLWGYLKAYYMKAKGDKSFSDRLSKLESITLEELQPLVKAMQEEKVAAYQERFIFDLLEEEG